MRTVGMALVEGLAARGVEVVFGIPGVHTIELYRGLTGSGIRHVTARHEGGAGFMADGYARVSGKPGVAFVITGPGVTNALTAIGQARADSVPLLVVSGVNTRSSLGRGMGWLHEMPDQQGMVATLCPSFRIASAEDVAPVLDAAWAAMLGGRPGPAHIEVPLDVMPLACGPLPGPVWPEPPPVPDLAEAARLLNAAARPVILAGGGCRWAEAELQAVAEALGAPVIQTVNARGLMHGHPLTLAASASLDAVRAVISASDQVLAVGTELGPTDYDMYVRGGLPDLSGMIRLDICAEQLARHPARLALQAEAKAALAALAPLLSRRSLTRAPEVVAATRAARAELTPKMQAEAQMVEAIRTALPEALIVGDSTQPVYSANLSYDHSLPRGFFNAATGFGSLGYGLGAAVGAAIAAKGAPVVCLTGDGGLQFCPGEIVTAVDENLPVTFLVWNNAAYREIAEAMMGAQIAVLGCDPTPLDFEPFARACRMPFQSVEARPEALTEALRAPQKGPRMIEVRVKL